MAGPLLVLALVLLAAAPEGASGRPWNVTFGGCVFTGDTDGSSLVRQGSCPDQAGLLDLSHRNITVVPGTVFRGMSKIWFLNLSYNNIPELPWDVFADLTSLVGLNISNNGIRIRNGSQPSAITDREARCYLNRYPDVQNVLEKNLSGTFPDSRHQDNVSIVLHNASEKNLSRTFPGLASRHQDNVSIVSNFWGTRNIDTAKSHWIQYGKNEKRDWRCPESYYYGRCLTIDDTFPWLAPPSPPLPRAEEVLPETIFANLVSLQYLDMSNLNESMYLPRGIYAGLNLSVLHIEGNDLSCVPLTNEQRGSLILYVGPNMSCESLDLEDYWFEYHSRYNFFYVLLAVSLFCIVILWAACVMDYAEQTEKYRKNKIHKKKRKEYLARFKTLDANHDGFISEKEFKKGWSTTPTTRYLEWKDVGSENHLRGLKSSMSSLLRNCRKKSNSSRKNGTNLT
jgi:hypothetical protein